jgi:hypothetical protein
MVTGSAAAVVVDGVRETLSSAEPDASTTNSGWAVQQRALAVLVVVVVQVFIAVRVARRGGMVLALMVSPVVIALCQAALVVAPASITVEVTYWPVAAARAMDVVVTMALFLIVSRNANYDGRAAIAMSAPALGVVLGASISFVLSVSDAGARSRPW